MSNYVISSQTILLDPLRDRDFLAEQRRDPVTGDLLRAHDEVVVCAACKSAFLVESWRYLGEKHCAQSQTLAVLPVYSHFRIHKKSWTSQYMGGKHAIIFRRSAALMLDLLITLFLSLFSSAIALAFFLLRDQYLGGSPGKMTMRLKLVHKHSGLHPSPLRTFLRHLPLSIALAIAWTGLISPLVFLLLIDCLAVLTALPKLGDFLAEIRLVSAGKDDQH